ncbi:T9SS type A sorting domain-containing protein [Tamlana crocina]|uniref:Matrixin family metalloprotease n=1 Tax=Tamlana crocina TaxID=393006 RepID=A0ABX1DE69_9FLAO|nr:T9SS type A sorting domain-containing protein [Tamlana crocina]NJX15303.1 matrixin family metalloprotease [Tamlana crocina]
MRKKILLKVFFALALMLSPESVVFAQGMLMKVPLKRQVENSTLVVEGRVVSQKSIWNADRNKILTINTVEVYKVFKGKSNLQIEIVTPGGTVEDITQTVVPSLSLNKGDVGVFTLYDNNIGLAQKTSSSLKKYKPYSSLQGFYRYDLRSNTATNLFAKKKDVEKSLYLQISEITGKPFTELVSFSVKGASEILNKNNNKALVPVITNFSPTTITAGTGSVLTITGSGFGSVKGKVGFSDADAGGDGFIDALDSQVLTWSNNEITVEVPSIADKEAKENFGTGVAGTGIIRVTDNGGASQVSSQELTVLYALSNNVDNGGDAVLIQHMGIDGETSMTWQMNTDFDANTPAKEAFLRAFNRWRCETGINWLMGSTTSVNVGVQDDINVVVFDENDPLDEGLLGVCITTSGSCGDTRDVVTELDIVFDNDTDWYFGSGDPAFEQYDFESVALHELGHGHQLEHVININDVMHYALSNSETQRFLSGNNETAAGIIQNFSTTTQMCGQTMMEDYSGSCSLGVAFTEVLTDQISVYPSPVNDILYIENGSAVSLDKVVLFDIGGRAILNIDMVDAPRVKAINVGEISKGIYFLNLVSGNTVVGKKVVVE